MRQQFLEQNTIKKVHHPVYSPDLAPSDFSLSGYVKYPLARSEFSGGEALLGAINAILRGIEKVSLESVFLEWMESLRRYIGRDEEYID
jgi:hypothetical protein